MKNNDFKPSFQCFRFQFIRQIDFFISKKKCVKCKNDSIRLGKGDFEGLCWDCYKLVVEQEYLEQHPIIEIKKLRYKKTQFQQLICSYNETFRPIKTAVKNSGIKPDCNGTRHFKKDDYYIAFHKNYKNYRRDLRKFTFQFNHKKITITTLKKRLFNDLLGLGLTNDLIEPFWSDILKVLEEYDLRPSKLEECIVKKKATPPNQKSMRGIAKTENNSLGSEHIKFVEFFLSEFGEKLSSGEQIEIGLQLSGLRIDGSVNRIHRSWKIYSGDECRYLSNWLKLFGSKEHKHCSVSPANYGNFQISIHSGANEELCNEELLKLGLEQLRDCLKVIGVSDKDIRKLIKKFYQGRTQENGFVVQTPKKEVESKIELRKWYPLGSKSIQFDESHGKLELDVRDNPNRSDMRNFNLIQDFDLYTKLDSKGIKLINSFSPESNSPSKPLVSISSVLTDKKDDIIGSKDINDLGKSFYYEPNKSVVLDTS